MIYHSRRFTILKKPFGGSKNWAQKVFIKLKLLTMKEVDGRVTVVLKILIHINNRIFSNTSQLKNKEI